MSKLSHTNKVKTKNVPFKNQQKKFKPSFRIKRLKSIKTYQKSTKKYTRNTAKLVVRIRSTIASYTKKKHTKNRLSCIRWLVRFEEIGSFLEK